jgi:DNA-binding GntR family transcriptional regulator
MTAMYSQIAQNITSLYNDGALHPGEKLSSESVLSEIHQVSRLTIRQALKELEGVSLIKRKPGTGTFVYPSITTNLYPSRLGFT